MRVRIDDPDPDWPHAFEREAIAIRSILTTPPVSIEHIGSTSVPGLCAKPIIDLLLEVGDVASLDAEPLERLGYERMGEFGIPGRRYFRKGALVRTHHLHAFATGDPGLLRHRAFRDYLRAHPDVARAYGDLKRSLASRNVEIEAYMDGKHDFVQHHERLALAWIAQHPSAKRSR
ncbi:MAG: GrpB family protein [Phycisphaerales bacterium]|nr:GrpB family protein [Phycisphaerales bacterium]